MKKHVTKSFKELQKYSNLAEAIAQNSLEIQKFKDCFDRQPDNFKKVMVEIAIPTVRKSQTRMARSRRRPPLKNTTIIDMDNGLLTLSTFNYGDLDFDVLKL